MNAALLSLVSTLGSSLLGIFGKSKEAAAQLADKLAANRADWLVAGIFVLWSVPMVHGYIDPAAAAARIAALDQLPAWYRDTFVWLTIFGMGYPLIPKVGSR